jgi:glucosamine-6-phosphate deaminase
MRVVIEATAELYRLAARRVAEQVRAKPACVLGLATGRTMLPLYDELARLHAAEGLSFARVTAFNLDEYVGLDPEQPGSFRHFMRVHLLERTDLPARSLHLPDAARRDPAEAARAYEAAIRAAGGIDLQLLGLGRNAHIGFNEPGSSLASRTRVKALAEETRAAGALPGRVRMAITLGLGTILEARACLLIATGAAKADAVAAAIEGPLTASAPASVLQLHPQVVAYVDDAAAAKLARRAYYREAEALQRRLEGEDVSGTC